MPSPLTNRRLAVAALLVLGLLASTSFGVWSGGVTAIRYDATRIDPGNATQVAAASYRVVDLDERVAATPAMRPMVERAVEDGPYAGTDHPTELYMLADGDDYRFAAYEGRLYRWNTSTRPDDTWVRIATRPTTGTAALDSVAKPYDEATDATRRAILTGNATTGSVNASVVERAGTYYSVGPVNEGRVFATILLGPLAIFAQTVGRAYVVVAAALLYFLRERDPTPLDDRRALAAVGAVVPAMWLWTAATESGSVALRFVGAPAFGACLALGLVAGWAIRRRAYARLLAASVLGAVGFVVLLAAAIGAIGAVLAFPGLLVAWMAGLPLALGGYVLTPATADDGGDAGDAPAAAE